MNERQEERDKMHVSGKLTKAVHECTARGERRRKGMNDKQNHTFAPIIHDRVIGITGCYAIKQE